MNKQVLHQACIEIAEQRLLSLKQSLIDLNESLDTETKSSAGDKHETGRAMIQLEQEQLAVQLSEAQKLVQSLKIIDASSECSIVTLGSLVNTPNGNYYIAAGLGKLNLDGTLYYVVSPSAPLALAIMGAEAGSTISFNNNILEISQIR